MTNNKKNPEVSSEEIINQLSKHTNLITCRFDNKEFYEQSLTGMIKEAFNFKTSYPKYEGKPLYIIFEEEKELIKWFASDENTKYHKEGEYSKYILDWANKYM